MSKFYWILGVVAVIGVGVVGYAVGSTGASGTAATSPVEVPGLDDPTQLVALAEGVVLGDEDAPISIVEFADYQCPGCATFAGVVKPQIQAAFIQSGEAKFIFYDFPLTSIHAHAFLAARAARCAGDQGRFWEFHDALFQNQQEWSFVDDATGSFVGYAADVGLDDDAFEECLRSDRHADVVTANMRLGEELGVGGTPTVMVSRGEGSARRVNSNRFQAIAETVRELQAEAAGASAEDGDAPQGG